jgi:hypothetical protein
MTRIFAIATLAVMFGYPPVGQAMEELEVHGTVAQTIDTSKHATTVQYIKRSDGGE